MFSGNNIIALTTKLQQITHNKAHAVGPEKTFCCEIIRSFLQVS